MYAVGSAYVRPLSRKGTRFAPPVHAVILPPFMGGLAAIYSCVWRHIMVHVAAKLHDTRIGRKLFAPTRANWHAYGQAFPKNPGLFWPEGWSIIVHACAPQGRDMQIIRMGLDVGS